MRTRLGMLACALAACDTSSVVRPKLSSVSPADGATGVAVNAAVSATFDTSLDAATVTAASFTLHDAHGAAVTGQVAASGATATFTPAAALAASTTFHAALTTAVTSKAGVALGAEVDWSFTTAAAAPQVPAIPTGVSATPADSAVTVSWGVVAGADSYNIYWSTTAGVTKSTHTGVLTSTTSLVTHTGLTNGTTYHYVVTAQNAVGESAESLEVSAVPAVPEPPGVPANLQATGQDSAVQLSWTAAAHATSYKVYWATATGVSKSNHTGVFTAASTQATHSALTNGTPYFYVVTGVNSAGESAESGEASATPQAAVSGAPPVPIGLAAAAHDGSATLTWSASAGATSYNLYWSTNASVSKSTGSQIAGVSSGYVHAGLTNDTPYTWVVTAVNGTGESNESSAAHATPTHPTAPMVRAVRPADAEAGVSVGSAITVTFSDAMNPATLTSSTVMLVQDGTPVDATVSASGKTVTITPAGDLSYSTGYTVSITTGATDLFSNALATPFNSVFTTQPEPPTGLAGIFGAGAVSLTWNDVPAASSYRIYRGSASGGPYALVGSSTAPAFTDTGVPSFSASYWVVTAVADGESPSSNEITGTANGSYNWAPFSIAAAALDGQVALTWTNSFYPAPSYQVLQSITPGGPYAPSGSLVTGMGTLVRGLNNGVRYYFVIQAVGSGTQSAYSPEVSAQPAAGIAAPGNLAATPNATWVHLTWDAVANASAYVVQRGTTPTGPYSPVATLSGTTYEDVPLFPANGLTPTPVDGTTYYYVVAAIDSGTGLQGAFSTEVSATPQTALTPVQPGLTAVASNQRVDLAIVIPPYYQYFSYSYERATTPGGPYTTVFSPDTGLTNGVTYYYLVRAKKSGNTVDSAEIAVTPNTTAPGAAVTGLTADPGNGLVTLHWAPVSGASGYQIQTASVSGGPYSNYGGPIAATAYTLSGTNAQTVYYVVSAVIGNNVGPNSAEVAGTPSSSAPYPPGYQTGTLPAVTPAITQAMVSWGAATGATGYKVRRSTDGYQAVIGTTSSTSFLDTAAPDGVTYAVSTVTAAGEGPWSFTSAPLIRNVGTMVAPVVTARPGNGDVSFSWNPVPGANSYVVLYSNTPGGPYQANLGAQVNTFYYVTQSNGTPLYVVVRACLDPAQTFSNFTTRSCSDWSAEASATPSAAHLAGVFSNSSFPGNGEISLSWNPVSGATGYHLYRIDPVTQAVVPWKDSPVNSAIDTPVPNGQPQAYVVSAYNGAGEGPWYSPGYPVTVTALSSKLAAPVVTGRASNGRIDLTWDPIPAADYYNIWYAPSPQGPFNRFGGCCDPASQPHFSIEATNGVLQYYAVSANGTHGNSGLSTPVAITPSASSPGVAIFGATAGNAEVEVWWPPVDGASSYNVWRLVGSPASWQRVGSSASSPFHEYGLTNLVSYTYALSAVVGGVDQGWNGQLSVTPSAAKPDPPRNVVVHPGNGALTVTWDPVEGVTLGYSGYCSPTPGMPGEGFSFSARPSLTAQFDNDTVQYCSAIASNDDNSDWSDQAQGTPSAALPAAPALSQPAAGSQQVAVAWSAVAGATSYLVYRLAPGGKWTLVGGGPPTSFVDTGLTANTEYFYAVAAVNGAGPGSWSNEASATPTP